MQVGDIVFFVPASTPSRDRPGVILEVHGHDYRVRWNQEPWREPNFLFRQEELVVVGPEEAILLRLAYPELCGD